MDHGSGASEGIGDLPLCVGWADHAFLVYVHFSYCYGNTDAERVRLVCRPEQWAAAAARIRLVLHRRRVVRNYHRMADGDSDNPFRTVYPATAKTRVQFGGCRRELHLISHRHD